MRTGDLKKLKSFIENCSFTAHTNEEKRYKKVWEQQQKLCLFIIQANLLNNKVRSNESYWKKKKGEDK